MDENITTSDLAEETAAPKSSGFMKFYGLYWDKTFIYPNEALLPGIPLGWIGQGTKSLDKSTVWMNFWKQKGVYVLYDDSLTPVYTGQAGLTKKTKKNRITVRDDVLAYACRIICGVSIETVGAISPGSVFSNVRAKLSCENSLKVLISMTVRSQNGDSKALLKRMSSTYCWTPLKPY